MSTPDNTFEEYLLEDVESYSGPQDLDASKFMSTLYDIDRSLQGKVAATAEGDIIYTTLLLAFGEERAQHHTNKLENDGVGLRPTAVIQDLRANYNPEGGGPDPHKERTEHKPEDEKAEKRGGGKDEKWDWDKGYVYDPNQDSYIFDLNCYPGPFIVSGERLRRMAKRYSRHHGDEMWHMDEVAAAEGMAEDAWKEIKNTMGITHKSPGHLPEDFERADLDEIENWAEADVQLKKHKYKQFNEQKTRREMEKAAKKYFQLEGQLEKVRELVEENPYEAPQLNIRVAGDTSALEPAALVVNAQDYHLGNRSVKKGLAPDIYMEQLLAANEGILERAARVAHVDKIYLVVGGDLLNVDNYEGSTTKGTPQDSSMTTSQILAEAEMFIRKLTDICRQVAEVELVPVSGNHDATLSQAIHQMALAHFEDVEDVIGRREYRQRQHRTWRDHFLCMTHGDYANKTTRRLPQICMREARELVAHTQHATIHSGHDHQEEVRFEKAGWLHQTAPAPLQLDEWHEDQAYVGGRRALQGTLHFEGGDDVILNCVLGRRLRETTMA